MEENEENARWKSAQRWWKDVTARCFRKCPVPKQLLLFAFIVVFVVVYSVLNRDVLRVSNELLDLQRQADTIKSFESKKISIGESESDVRPLSLASETEKTQPETAGSTMQPQSIFNSELKSGKRGRRSVCDKRREKR